MGEKNKTKWLSTLYDRTHPIGIDRTNVYCIYYFHYKKNQTSISILYIKIID